MEKIGSYADMYLNFGTKVCIIYRKTKQKQKKLAKMGRTCKIYYVFRE